MKMKTLIIFSLIALTFNSCQTNECENFSKRDGIIISKYSEGNIRLKFRVKNCLYEGNYQEFYPNGIAKATGSFRTGKKNDEWSHFDEMGKLISKSNFDLNGRLTNIKVYYSSSFIELKRSAGIAILTSGDNSIKLELVNSEWYNLNFSNDDGSFVLRTDKNLFVFDRFLNKKFNLSEKGNVYSLYKENDSQYQIIKDTLIIDIYVHDKNQGLSVLKKHTFSIAPEEHEYPQGDKLIFKHNS